MAAFSVLLLQCALSGAPAVVPFRPGGEARRALAAAPARPAPPAPSRVPRPAPPADGVVRFLVLLIEYPDLAHDPGKTVSYYSNLLFSSSNASVRSYYSECSYGQLDVQGTVHGWYLAAQDRDYYAYNAYVANDYPRTPARLVEEALDAFVSANPAFDSSPYDSDGDGEMDAVILVHAGDGYEDSGDSDDIHSHYYFLNHDSFDDWFPDPTPYALPDGGEALAFCIDAETSPIGVQAHEIGHVFGLPDLYGGVLGRQTIGVFCLMGEGAWLGGGDAWDGTRPAHFSAWCKFVLGWIDPQRAGAESSSYVLSSITSCPDALLLAPEGSSPRSSPWPAGIGGQEYFLVAHRTRTGFDADLPGEGILIWHVTELVADNTVIGLPLVDLEEPGVQTLERPISQRGYDNGSENDYWRSGSFDTVSSPDSAWTDGVPSGIAVYDFTFAGESATLSAIGGRAEIPFAFPNPYRSDSGGPMVLRVGATDFGEVTSLRVHTVDGIPVAGLGEFEIHSSQAGFLVWSDPASDLPPGIYLYRLDYTDGEGVPRVERGRFAVAR